ncbi:hypothetical protein CDCA_CDCA19G4619 [Cyanidium caldarium]|uniref:Iron-sulfur cluster assembly SufBD family protein ycf24 n=1 Tax=Cyanidium caldarium TaxID=2771 RepID=A0AAV9J2N6_CYACA|nr:hypothetical protein CDCA_CDCA19G4619 [Cyanidium caldarium]
MLGFVNCGIGWGSHAGVSWRQGTSRCGGAGLRGAGSRLWPASGRRRRSDARARLLPGALRLRASDLCGVDVGGASSFDGGPPLKEPTGTPDPGLPDRGAPGGEGTSERNAARYARGFVDRVLDRQWVDGGAVLAGALWSEEKRLARERLETALRERQCPSRRLEAFRNTDVLRLYTAQFASRPSAPTAVDAELEPLPPALRARCERALRWLYALEERPSLPWETLPEAGTLLRVVFVNGRLAPELCSDADTWARVLPSGAYFGDVHDSRDTHPDLPRRFVQAVSEAAPESGMSPVKYHKKPGTHDYQKGRSRVSDFFSLVNVLGGSNTLGRGVNGLYVPRGGLVDGTIDIVSIVEPGVVLHPRLVVLAEAGAMASISQQTLVLDGEATAGDQDQLGTLVNECVSVELAEDASVKLHMLGPRCVPREDGAVPDASHLFFLSGVTARCQRDSTFSVVNVQMGEPYLHRVCVGVDLLGEHASAALHSVAAVGSDHTADMQTRVSHHAAQTDSRQVQKNVVYGRARAVFHGRILVAIYCDDTDAHQLCRTLLLSPGARAFVLPALEINNDQVQCSHGAAIGTVNEDEVVYLRSRGLTDMQARHMIALGFVREVATKLPAPMKKRLTEPEIVLELERPPQDADAEDGNGTPEDRDGEAPAEMDPSLN